MIEPTERPSSVDDMATLREQQFTDAALAAARRPVLKARPGLCLNCGAQLASLAVYCDEDCRADHEQRLQSARRRGAGG